MKESGVLKHRLLRIKYLSPGKKGHTVDKSRTAFGGVKRLLVALDVEVTEHLFHLQHSIVIYIIIYFETNYLSEPKCGKQPKIYENSL